MRGLGLAASRRVDSGGAGTNSRPTAAPPHRESCCNFAAYSCSPPPRKPLQLRGLQLQASTENAAACNCKLTRSWWCLRLQAAQETLFALRSLTDKDQVQASIEKMGSSQKQVRPR